MIIDYNIGHHKNWYNMDWNEYFLGIAEQVKLKSKDQSTQIGAVIDESAPPQSPH